MKTILLLSTIGSYLVFVVMTVRIFQLNKDYHKVAKKSSSFYEKYAIKDTIKTCVIVGTFFLGLTIFFLVMYKINYAW